MGCTVIGLSGKRGCGKTTLAHFMEPKGWAHESFAAELKKRVRADFNLTEEHTDGSLKELPTVYTRTDGAPLTPRDIMIRCGFYYRSIDPMFWVRTVYEKIELISRPTCDELGRPWEHEFKFVISDVRYKNEADYIKDRGGILVRLSRPESLNIYKGVVNDPSETELDDYTRFDLVIPAEENKTLADLEKVASRLEDTYGLLV